MNLVKTGGNSNGWTLPPDHHVTTLYLGNDPDRTEHPIYKNHKDGLKVPVAIQALLVVKDRIITAITFPRYEVDNEFPHVTMLVKKWKPFLSNLVLEATCRPGKAFHILYKQMESGKMPSPGVWESDSLMVKGETVKANLVVLDKAFVF